MRAVAFLGIVSGIMVPSSGKALFCILSPCRKIFRAQESARTGLGQAAGFGRRAFHGQGSGARRRKGAMDSTTAGSGGGDNFLALGASAKGHFG